MNYFTKLAKVTRKHCLTLNKPWSKKQRRAALIPMIERHLKVQNFLKNR